VQLVMGDNMHVVSSSGGSLSNSQSSSTSGRKLEVSMMIDLTGSMGWSDAPGSAYSKKIDALQAAGKDLLDIILPTSGAHDNDVRVAVAPFADYVNAGSYAAAATGLDAAGGSYANITDLARTRNGAFTGSYSGLTGGSAGSQAGVVGGSDDSFDNGYCSAPTTTTTASVETYNGYRTGVYVPDDSDGDADFGGTIYVSRRANRSDEFKRISSADGDGHTLISYNNDTYTGRFVPRLTSTAGLTVRTFSYSNRGYSYTGNIGVEIDSDRDYSTSGMQALGFVKATNSQGYWKLTRINGNGSASLSWETSGWYLPVYEDLTVTTTTAGCESSVQTKPSAKLISCVTERTDSSNRYTDATPSEANGWIGAYNHGSSGRSNYSSDGKCNTAGRELPQIIPLTNQRTALDEFFDNMTVGGGTPGHLGTAWAWYMLSPNWASVFTDSVPAAYGDQNVKKIAILMTDGEYNMYYANGTASGSQALSLCSNMKAAGIEVYTIGFGMGQNVTANASGTAAQRAKYTLEQCSNGAGYHYFPYDGAALRAAFTAIGNSLQGEFTSTTVVGARLTR
ncbi:MAG: hypothetical protein AB7O43_06785, partial [Hyphomicrobiaceae bacterium]